MDLHQYSNKLTEQNLKLHKNRKNVLYESVFTYNKLSDEVRNIANIDND